VLLFISTSALNGIPTGWVASSPVEKIRMSWKNLSGRRPGGQKSEPYAVIKERLFRYFIIGNGLVNCKGKTIDACRRKVMTGCTNGTIMVVVVDIMMIVKRRC
jgi:hypothetical protein